MAMRGLACGLACALLVLRTVSFEDEEEEEERKEVTDIPADPKLSYGWSKYRYTRYDKMPMTGDKETSVLAGGDVKCEVCEVILADVLGQLLKSERLGVASANSDVLLEALEAEVVDEKKIDNAASAMDRAVEKHKKGCNKLFKDSYLAKGWGIRSCTKLAPGQQPNAPEDEKVPWACAQKSMRLPSARVLNTYSVQSEAVHYACEATIERNRDELVEFLADRVKAAPKGFGTKVLEEFVAEACRTKAKCLKRKPSESAESRMKMKEVRLKRQDEEVDDLIRKTKKQMKQAKKTKEGSEEQTVGQSEGETVEL